MRIKDICLLISGVSIIFAFVYMIASETFGSQLKGVYGGIGLALFLIGVLAYFAYLEGER